MALTVRRVAIPGWSILFREIGIPLPIGLIIFGLGASFLWKPTWMLEMSPGVYREEYLARRSTRFGSRFVGYIFMQFGLVLFFPAIAEKAIPGIDAKALYQLQYGLFLVVFLACWTGGVVLGLASLIGPLRRRLSGFMDRKGILSERRQIILICCATPIIPLLALIGSLR